MRNELPLGRRTQLRSNSPVAINSLEYSDSMILERRGAAMAAKTRYRTRLLIASSGILAIGGLVVVASPARAQGTTFAQATEVSTPTNASSNPGAILDGVSCSSAGNCTAAGNYNDNSGNVQAMATTETAGTWARATEVTAPTNAGSNFAFLREVSCSSAGNCTAAGNYDDSSGNFQVSAATETSGVWARATEVTAPTNAAGNPGAILSGVSCSSAGNCSASGDYADTASRIQAMVARETSGTWTRATEVIAPANAGGNPGAYLRGVSCSSAGNCTATGAYSDNSGNGQAMATTETSGTWARATEVNTPANGASSQGSILVGVSCSSAGNCTAAGVYIDSSSHVEAMAATETSGTWARATEVTAPANVGNNPVATLQGISCSSAGNCTSAGYYLDSSSNFQAMLARETSGTWTRATEVTAPANARSNPGAELYAISCSSAGNCTAAGDYNDSAGNLQGMVETSTSPLTHSSGGGYWQVGNDGGMFAFGDAHYFGSLPGHAIHVSNIVGMAATPDGGGYWLVGDDGGMFAFGDAHYFGSLPGHAIHVSNIVGMAATPDGGGYWLVGDDGGMFAFGDAHYFGSLPGHAIHVSNIVGMAATPDGGGYWLVGDDGGMFAFGDAHYFGSLPGHAIHVSNIVGMAATPDGGGYWLVGDDGGMFAFGDAHYFGSLPGHAVHVSNIVGRATTPDGGGYWLVGDDGGMFAFGDAHYFGSLPGLGVHVSNIVGMKGST